MKRMVVQVVFVVTALVLVAVWWRYANVPDLQGFERADRLIEYYGLDCQPVRLYRAEGEVWISCAEGGSCHEAQRITGP